MNEYQMVFVHAGFVSPSVARSDWLNCLIGLLITALVIALWRSREMQMESDGKVDLVKLHGELIAFDFIEPNTGQMPCWYRLTRAGLKAVREIAAGTGEVVNHAA
jgi:hypothetical protein